MGTDKHAQDYYRNPSDDGGVPLLTSVGYGATIMKGSVYYRKQGEKSS